MLAILSFGALLLLLGAATIRWPAVAIAAVICMFGLEQWGLASGAARSFSQAFTNVAVGAMVAAALVVRIVRGECVFCRLPGSYWWGVALLVYAFASTLWTLRPDLAWQNWQASGPYVATVVLAAPLLAQRVEDFAIALRWLAVIGGIICAAVLFLGEWGYRGLIVGGNAGTLADEANPLAIATLAGEVFLAVTLFPAFKNSIFRWATAIAVAAVSVALIVRTGSRGQLLAAMIGFLIAWPIARRGRLALRTLSMPVALAVLGAVAFFSVDYFGTDAARWDTTLATDDIDGRLANAELLVGAASANPATLLFGLGSSAAYAILGIYPHIVPLEILAELGVFGLALFASFLISGIVPVRGALAAAHDTSSHSALVTLLATAVFHVVLIMKQGSMLFSTLLFMHVILLAKLAMLVKASTTVPKQDAHTFLPARPVNLLS